ncbi:hypothetical protein BOTBODRAFT_61755 [Botryobasidium botryosum FD-172 SS1]|uniref:Choline kinase N-terminal domain-containing protein n=1 Tax=Botryobasidium botryosum (strain FD-172 SS1) TaxID=930990 RepID=A0A067N941_BOTB1|nr:hypothetical protein BOTBODRAFT_61755 [Botryobasidium botryosum FD-172 SS1]
MTIINPMSSPTLGPTPAAHPPPLLHSKSHSSLYSLRSANNSTASLNLPSSRLGEEVVVEGLVHSESRLDARRYKTREFAEQLLTVLRRDLRVQSWTSDQLVPDCVRVHKVVGSLTNAVLFASYDAPPSLPLSYIPATVLIRIYGPSSSTLINRAQELRTLHVLSSTYGFGPRVFGTFGNGRVEEYFYSQALTVNEMRNPTVSRWIGKNMRDLHSVDIRTVIGEDGDYAHGEIAVSKSMREWIEPAREVLRVLQKRLAQLKSSDPDAKHPWADVISSLDFERFLQEWELYWDWVQSWEARHGKSERVFAHNDAQYGNLLRLRSNISGGPAYQQIIVVDFEYAAPNPAAFDIANHFHEWCTDYNASTNPHASRLDRYPTEAERAHFYRAYLDLPSIETKDARAKVKITNLEAHVKIWAPAPSAVWTVWGIVQARDDVVSEDFTPGDFDYLAFAIDRAGIFRQGAASLGALA